MLQCFFVIVDCFEVAVSDAFSTAKVPISHLILACGQHFIGLHYEAFILFRDTVTLSVRILWLL